MRFFGRSGLDQATLGQVGSRGPGFHKIKLLQIGRAAYLSYFELNRNAGCWELLVM